MLASMQKPMHCESLSKTVALSLRAKLKVPVSVADVRVVLMEINAAVAECLASGQPVKLQGLGTLQLRPHGGGTARNVKCLARGETELVEWLEIPPHLRVVFVPAESLKARTKKLPVPEGFQARRR